MIFKVIACISICIGWGNAFEVFQPNRVEANNSGVARLRCNYNFTGKGEEFRITLFRGISDQTIVCASSFHLPNTTFETKEGLFSCQGEASRNSVDLTISGMSSSDTDIYKCRVEIMYPPPYRQRVGNGTVIYIPEIQTCPKIESSMEWIIVAVSGCIIACTVIIIAAILVIRICQQKWKADYVDMSPVISEKRNSNNRYVIL